MDAGSLLVCLSHLSHRQWLSIFAATRRQDDVGVGSAFDGSQGVDSEDILNIPEIGFGSFQLFPDQVSYGPVDPNLPAFNNTVQTGIDWIKRHAEAGQACVASLGFLHRLTKTSTAPESLFLS